ncbi:MAG: alpha/beta hydrolase [Sphingomonadales bacterium]|nr:MAG: alpha/beta hydrolase [Sphingomonadales bacterium]TNF01869.1 MAG: alpha/beta hydrolase [Sphingomonadales bacterium]
MPASTNPESAALSENSASTLIVPGLGNSGPDHWQTLWEQELPDCRRVELGLWDHPHRNLWITKLGIAIRQAQRPVFIVAHSLGCHALAWWAQQEKTSYADKIAGALLVAPPELDSGMVDPRLIAFAPTPLRILPFPSIVVASGNDPYIDIDRARRLAFFWGSDFADAGHVGHINAESDLGHWDFGLFLLNRLIGRAGQARLAIDPGALRVPSGNVAAPPMV